MPTLLEKPTTPIDLFDVPITPLTASDVPRTPAMFDVLRTAGPWVPEMPAHAGERARNALNAGAEERNGANGGARE
jgi:hypothetical protein